MAGYVRNIEKILSASKIKTLEDCSWVYWAKYHLNLPDEANEGSARGSICHLIFELLLKEKHRKYYDQILKDHSIENCKVIQRLITKHLNSYDFNTQENYDLIEKMLYIGLNHDFFEEGGVLGEAEKSFSIHNKRLKYKIRGFIDKHAYYDNNNLLIITDYKSSKQKFKGDGLSANVQAMMYTLAGQKFSPKPKRIKVRFLFLRFPKVPMQELEFSKEEISGFEHYLTYLNEVIDNFNEADAISNYAADKYETKWFCAAGKTWICPLRDPYYYYALLDENGKVIKTSKKDNLIPEKGQEVEKMKYLGCPKYHPNDVPDVLVKASSVQEDTITTAAEESKDPFNIGAI